MDHAKVKATRIASAVAGGLMATSGAQADILTFKIDADADSGAPDFIPNAPPNPDLRAFYDAIPPAPAVPVPDFVGNPAGLTGKGLFTIITGGGAKTPNSSYPYYGDPTWGGGIRTQFSGSLTYSTTTGMGTMVVNPFNFFRSGEAAATNATVKFLGDTVGNGKLILYNSGFDWNNNVGIPVSQIWDARGFLAAIDGGLLTETDPDNKVVGGVLAATDGIRGKIPIGAIPLATTTLDTTTITSTGCIPFDADTPCMGLNPSASGWDGVSDDGIGGSPMIAGPFAGFNANIDR